MLKQIEKNQRKKIMQSLSGLTVGQFNELKGREKREYLNSHPHSKYWKLYDKKVKKIKPRSVKKLNNTVDSNFDNKDIEKVANEFAEKNTNFVDASNADNGITEKEWDTVLNKGNNRKDEDEASETKRVTKKAINREVAKKLLIAGAILLAGPLLPLVDYAANEFADKEEKEDTDNEVMTYSEWLGIKYPDRKTRDEINSDEAKTQTARKFYEQYKSWEDKPPEDTKFNYIKRKSEKFMQFIKTNGIDKLKAKYSNMRNLENAG